jgi:hypothetical protein
VYDVLKAQCDPDSVHVSGPSDETIANSLGVTGCEYLLRFCRISAALGKATNGKDQVHPIQVFYTCRNVEAHGLTADQLRSLDICTAATWLLDGGRALWETGSRVPKRALGEKPRLGDEILAARGWVDNRTVAVVGREATCPE